MKPLLLITSIFLSVVASSHAEQQKKPADRIWSIDDIDGFADIPDISEDDEDKPELIQISVSGRDNDDDNQNYPKKPFHPYLFDLFENAFVSAGESLNFPVRDAWGDYLTRNFFKPDRLNQYLNQYLSEPVTLLPVVAQTELRKLIQKLSRQELSTLTMRLKIKYKVRFDKKTEPVDAIVQLHDKHSDFPEAITAIINNQPNPSNALSALGQYFEDVQESPRTSSILPMPETRTLPGVMSIGDFQSLTGIKLSVQSGSASVPHVHAFETMNQLISAHLLGQVPLPPAEELVINGQSLESSEPQLFCPDLTGIHMPPSINHLHWTADQLACQMLMDETRLPLQLRIVLEDAETGIVRIVTPLSDVSKKPRLSVSYQEDDYYRFKHGIPAPEYDIVIQLPPLLSRNSFTPSMTLPDVTWKVRAKNADSVSGIIADVRAIIETRLESVIANQLRGKEWVHASRTTDFRFAGISLTPAMHQLMDTPIEATAPIFVGGTPIEERLSESSAGFSESSKRFTDTSMSLKGLGARLVFAESEMTLKDCPQAQALSIARNYFASNASLSSLFRGLYIRFTYAGSPVSRDMGYLLNKGGAGPTYQNFDTAPKGQYERYHDVTVTFANPQVLIELLSGLTSLSKDLAQDLINIEYAGEGSGFATEDDVLRVVQDTLYRLEPESH